jgi:hypothetical protein
MSAELLGVESMARDRPLEKLTAVLILWLSANSTYQPADAAGRSLDAPGIDAAGSIDLDHSFLI